MGAIEAFETLNERQREAARYGQRAAGGAFQAGPLLIIAGAGTGKTNTLAHRVAHLLLHGINSERILLLTFTRRAALEMTRRAQRIAGQEGAAKAAGLSSVRLPWSGTFHSIANRLIRKNCNRVGLDERFSVLDRGDAADLLDVARHELGFSKVDGEGAKRFPRKDTCLAIYSHRVNTQGSLAATLEAAFPWCAEWEGELKKLFGSYVDKKLNNQALDYDDLLLYWHAMMADEALAKEVSESWDHVLVDEYQDTNLLQAEILQRLRPRGDGLTVVGDDAQAIYSFRAASVENILDFEERFSAGVVKLEENYRSTQPVLDAANALMRQASMQYQKELKSKKIEGAKPRYVTVADDAAQAQYVVTRVLEAREQGTDLRRQAVLFRSSQHSDALELELVRRNIPYVKYGGLKFLEAAHVKDALSLLRWADNPKNRVAAWRALQLLPGVGPVGAEKAFAAFYENGFHWKKLNTRFAEFNALMQFLGDPDTPWPGQMQRVREWYEPMLERLHEAPEVRMGDLVHLERISGSFEKRETFLTELALDPPSATSDLAGAPLLDEDYLVLSTVHSAKGQEWEAVYLLNVSDGNFPNEFATGKPEQIEEERRLLYVAMTRAKTSLELVAPLKYYVTQQARLGDRHVYGAKSRFLTRKVMACFEETCWSDEKDKDDVNVKSTPVDVAAKLRGMWA